MGVPPRGGAAAYGGLAGGAPLARLEAEGLAWVPAWGNALAGLCFALCLVLNEQLAQVCGAPCLGEILSVHVSASVRRNSRHCAPLSRGDAEGLGAGLGQ